ncbi:MAG: GspE/PulE family protein [Fuerstiella sp.]|nr:GspE/PulE family protein [Fuerstiella sp.]
MNDHPNETVPATPQELAEQYGMPYEDLETFRPNHELIKRFPSQDLFRTNVLPLRSDEDRIAVAVSDPLNLDLLDELSVCSGLLLDPVVADKAQIERWLKKCLGVGGGTVQELVAMSVDEAEALQAAAEDEIDDVSQASSVVKLVNELLVEAVELRASDVHIEPEEDGLDVRFRVDGILRLQPVPQQIHRFRAAIVSRLKIMSRLNIAEKRRPQDGRIKLAVSGREIDVRASVIPMLHGEGVVLRLLDNSQAQLDLDFVNFPDDLRQQWNHIIRKTNGLVLVTGPTGSGKTTTLYSSLCEIRSPERKIITVEDPVEYNLRGVSQIQVHDQVGLNFSEGLRSILRHDPDVVLIGEVRDEETACSAIQASLTGHLVLSTLHTNDAASAFTRLIDMGVEPYLVASTVEAVLAQRLIRRLCRSCKQQITSSQPNLPTDLVLNSDQVIYEAKGCRECHQTGYNGRLAVFELLVMNNRIRTLCNQNTSTAELRRQALSDGMLSLRQMGWQQVVAGNSTLSELVRVCPDPE